MFDPEPESDEDSSVGISQGDPRAQLAAEDFVFRAEIPIFQGEVVLKQSAYFGDQRADGTRGHRGSVPGGHRNQQPKRTAAQILLFRMNFNTLQGGISRRR